MKKYLLAVAAFFAFSSTFAQSIDVPVFVVTTASQCDIQTECQSVCPPAPFASECFAYVYDTQLQTGTLVQYLRGSNDWLYKTHQLGWTGALPDELAHWHYQNSTYLDIILGLFQPRSVRPWQGTECWNYWGNCFTMESDQIGGH